MDDVERGRAFYGALFDWSFEPGPSGESAGAVIRTATVPGGMHGGDPGASAYVFFAVDAPYGQFRMCRDDQGSPFGLHVPPRTG